MHWELSWRAKSGTPPKIEDGDGSDECKGVSRCHETKETAELDVENAEKDESELKGMDVVVDVEFENARGCQTVPLSTSPYRHRSVFNLN